MPEIKKATRNVMGGFSPKKTIPNFPISPNEKSSRTSFEDWYKTITLNTEGYPKNDTMSYNLRRAYEIAPQKQLDDLLWYTYGVALCIDYHN